MPEARHVARTHTIHLQGPPEEVFPLFTPLGERHWVPGWTPQPRYPASGEAVDGAVFTTLHADDPETIWVIAGFEPAHYRARYVRVTPGSRAAVVDVRCADAGDGTTRAEVTYAFTALSEAGNAYVDAFTEAHYRAYIDAWEAAINRYLAGDPG